MCTTLGAAFAGSVCVVYQRTSGCCVDRLTVMKTPTRPSISTKLAAQASPGGRHKETFTALQRRLRARASVGDVLGCSAALRAGGLASSIRSISLRNDGPGA